MAVMRVFASPADNQACQQGGGRKGQDNHDDGIRQEQEGTRHHQRTTREMIRVPGPRLTSHALHIAMRGTRRRLHLPGKTPALPTTREHVPMFG